MELNKFKIAILTLYYHNYNYGGLLQAYALQQILRNCGGNAEQISYVLRSGYISKYPGFLAPFVNFGHNAKQLPWLIKNQKSIKKMDRFADSIPHTSVFTAKTIKNLEKDYDVFICGSDQIWNPIGWQPTLFLDFVTAGKHKIAYAASIARDHLSDDELAIIKQYTSDFKAISVRERTSAEILNNKFPELNVKVMPDPTFLLEKKDWEKVSCNRLINEPYIFAYFLGDDMSKRELVIKYAEREKIKVVFIPFMKKQFCKWDSVHKNVMYSDGAGAKEFLSLIRNSEGVITDSYHGMIFSLLFQKPFYIMKRFSDNDRYSMNSRVEMLINLFQEEKRYIDSIPEGSINEMSLEEREKVGAILSEIRFQGIEFLNDSVLSI